MDLQPYFDIQLDVYENYGVLLSQAELALFDSAASLVVSSDLKALIDKSRDCIQRDLDLQIATLTEAEAARDRAEKLSADLETANSQLQARNSLTEAQLAHEKEMRSQQSKADFQKNLAMYLVGLIAVALVLPYVFSVFKPIGQELSSSTYNLTLLLINGLMIAVGSIFNRRENEKPE